MLFEKDRNETKRDHFKNKKLFGSSSQSFKQMGISPASLGPILLSFFSLFLTPNDRKLSKVMNKFLL